MPLLFCKLKGVILQKNPAKNSGIMETKTVFCQLVKKRRLFTGFPGNQGFCRVILVVSLWITLLIMWKTSCEQMANKTIIFPLCKPIFRLHWMQKTAKSLPHQREAFRFGIHGKYRSISTFPAMPGTEPVAVYCHICTR